MDDWIISLWWFVATLFSACPLHTVDDIFYWTLAGQHGKNSGQTILVGFIQSPWIYILIHIIILPRSCLKSLHLPFLEYKTWVACIITMKYEQQQIMYYKKISRCNASLFRRGFSRLSFARREMMGIPSLMSGSTHTERERGVVVQTCKHWRQRRLTSCPEINTNSFTWTPWWGK